MHLPFSCHYCDFGLCAHGIGGEPPGYEAWDRLDTAGTFEEKFLLLSHSLQRILTHFSLVARPRLALGPLSKLQTAVETAAFVVFNLASDPDTAATVGLHHPLVRMQLRPPLREGCFGLNANGVVPDSSAVDY
jgi:hypothetical protein